MKFRSAIVHLALAATIAAGRAQEQDQPRSPFEPGETLVYDVTWSVFPAGDVRVELVRAGEESAGLFEVITTARSKGFVSLIFRVENEFRALFDPDSLCSRKILKKIHEGPRHRETQIVFDAKKRVAVFEDRDLKKPDQPPRRAVNDIPACVADVLTAFYVVRRRPLEVGESFVLPINDGAKTHAVAVEVQAREEIETPLGRHAALRVEPKVFGTLYRRKGRMQIWFSDDERRLPLRIKASVSVGAITGTLRATGDSASAKEAAP